MYNITFGNGYYLMYRLATSKAAPPLLRQKWIQKGAIIHWKIFAELKILDSALPTVWIGGTNLLIDLVKQYGRIFSCLS